MEVKVGRVYRHFKGDYYLVLGFATHSETNEKMVIYKALYNEGEVYVRPYNLFIEKVDKKKYPNVVQTDRFELQCIKSVKG